MDISKITTKVLMDSYQKMKYPTVDESKGFNLNIMGIRTADIDSNDFNDWIILWNRAGFLEKFKATTDPGLYWRLNPMNVKGTGILCTGYYVACWSLGLHQGKYEALVQLSKVKAYRDNNKDKKIDRKKESLEEGIFGMNLHKAGLNSTKVDKWSAMCQVLANCSTRRPGFANPVWDWDYLLSVLKKTTSRVENKFDYALFLESELVF